MSGLGWGEGDFTFACKFGGKVRVKDEPQGSSEKPKSEKERKMLQSMLMQ